MPPSLSQLHSDFLEDLEIGHGRSPRTVANYDHYLKRFYREEAIQSVADITLATIRQFRHKLSSGQLLVSASPAEPQEQQGRRVDSRGLSLATQNYHLIAIRQFLRYLAQRDIEALSPDKIGLAKVAERDIDVLYPEEIDALLAAPSSLALDSLRDRALLTVLFSTGMRISELVRLNRDDIRVDGNEVPVRGKGNKIRVVFLSEAAQEALANYLKQRHDIDPALFIRHKKGAAGPKDDLRLTPRSIQRSMKKYALVAGLTKRITPHTLRHSFATDLLSNGADVRYVQELLGHASITTTQIYTHLTDTHLRDIHARFHRGGQK